MINELEFPEIYRNEFIRKLAMIDQTIKNIDYKRIAEKRKQDEMKAKMRSKVRRR
jgi:hypothetical protein